MIKYWLGYEFPIELILDFGNYSLFCLIFFYFYKKKLFNQNLFFLLCFFMLTPFLFNNFFIDWKLSPDQSKYLSITNQIRNGTFNENYYNNPNIKVIISGYLFSFFPLISIETFKSVGFLNRFILLVTTVYLFKKNNIDLKLFLLVILTPSLTYFSSIFLRETLILVLMIWSIYFILEKNYFYSIIPLSILSLIKFQNFLIILVFLYLNFIFNFKKKFAFIIINIIVVIVVMYFYGDILLQEFNSRRQGMYFENFGNYKGITSNATYKNLDVNLDLIIITLKSIALFVLSPIFSSMSWLKLLIFLETIILYIFFVRDFLIEKNPKLKSIIILWFIILLFSFVMYSLAVFNDGTIHRFRLNLIFFVLFGYNMHKFNFLKKKLHDG
jgi:hypothetical protein